MFLYRREGPRLRARTLPLLFLAAGLCSAFPRQPAHALGGPRQITVTAEGEFRKAGTYALPADATLSTLLLAAGGFTDNAFLRGAVLTRASVRERQEAELRQMITRVSPDNDATVEARDATRPIVLLLSSLRPCGRVPVRLTHPRLLKGSPADLPLEEGDVLRIPAKTGYVAVAGAVRTASPAVPFSEKLPYEGYIARAGGYAGDADRNHVLLLRADGTAALLSLGFLSWNPVATRWEVTALTGATPAVGPGDTIVVSRRPPPGLPKSVARELPGILMRAAEIAGTPVIVP
jgi:hypothetical protein